eukprot:gene7295-8483_t
MLNKAAHKRLHLTIKTNRIYIDKDIPNHMFYQVGGRGILQDTQILDIIVKSRADFMDTPSKSALWIFRPLNNKLDNIDHGVIDFNMNRTHQFEDHKASYEPIIRGNLTLNLNNIHSNYFINHSAHRIQSMDTMASTRGRVIRPIKTINMKMTSKDHTQYSIGYDPEDKIPTLYSEPFESVETMLVEFNDIADTLPLIRHLFTSERLVTKSIAIVGPCRLKFSMEQYLDIFLSHNRVWEIETRSNEICDFGDKSDQYGLLSLLTLVDPVKYRFYRHLDARQYQTSNWRKTYQPEISFDRDAQCNNSRVLIGQLKDRGMMSSIHQVAYSFTEAIMWDRILIMEDTIFQFAYHWEELFLTSSSCLLPEVVNLIHPKELVQLVNENSITNPMDQDVRVLRMTSQDMAEGFLPNSEFPSGYFSNELQFRGHVMGYLLRPSTVMRKIIHDIKKDMFNSQKMPRCVSLHVRNGDKLEEVKVHSIDYYIDKMADYNVGYNYTDVFIMSDNTTVLLDSTLAAYPRYRFHKINLERYNGREAVADRLLQGTGNRFEAGATVFAEVTLASQCDFFFGTLSSNVGRSIVELMVAANPNIDIINWLSVDGSVWLNQP